MEPIRVAAIGCGEITQLMHLRFIDELPNLQLVALCDLSEHVLETLGARYGVEDHLYTSYDELLARAPVDAVLVATPDHAGPAIAALTCNKHLLLEKPIAFGVAEATAIAEAARHSRAVSMMGYMRAYDPGIELMRERVARMGELKLARSHNFGNSALSHEMIFSTVKPRPDERLAESAGDLINASTGRLLAEAVGSDTALQRLYWSLLMGDTHDLSILRTVLGRPTEVLYSHIDETRLIGVLRYGATVCELEWETASTYAWWDQTTTIYGSTSVIEARLPDPYVPYAATSVFVNEAGDDLPTTARVSVSNESPFRREWLHFASCIETGRQARTTIDAGLHDLEVVAGLVRRAAG